MRNHLHGAPEIVAAPLLLDDRHVDLAGGPVAVARRLRAREALVVAEVEIGLGAVVGDVDLAVLVRAHRARIDVDVRVELLQRDAVAVAFEQRADRGGGQALAERRDDAAGHEDVLGRTSVGVHGRFGHVGLYTRNRPPASADARAPDRPGCPRPAIRRPVSTTLMRMPCSSARSCSSDSARSSGGRRQRREPQQRVAPIDVEADVRARVATPLVAAMGNRGAREIERKACRSRTTLTTCGLAQLAVIVAAPAQRAHLDRGDRPASGATAASIIAGIEQRLVALHVDDDAARQGGGDLRQTIGARGMRGIGHAARLAAEASTASAMRSSSVATITRVDARAAEARAIDVLDHRTAGDVDERFSGEAGRVVSRGESARRRMRSQLGGTIPDRNRGHGESYHMSRTALRVTHRHCARLRWPFGPRSRDAARPRC